jgi:hypothetical protein
MKLITYALLLIFSANLYAQKKSSNNDLRNNSKIFLIENLLTDKFISYSLESSTSGAFNFSKIEKSKNKVWKISRDYANGIDTEFADHFISMKYMMKENKEKNCKPAFKLFFRGEKFEICKNDKSRIDIVTKFVLDLEKNLN